MKLSNVSGIHILGIKTTLPSNYIDYEQEFLEYSSDKKLLKRRQLVLGLKKRHVCQDTSDSYDLAINSAQELIKELSLSPESIDCVIYASISHRFITPASACLAQKDLKLSESCTAFDLSGLSCSGYVHALMIAHSLLNSGISNRVLVLAADMLSKHTDKRNRISNILFGDAGTATILERSSSNNNQHYFLTGTRGQDWDKIIAPAGGYYLPIREDICKTEVVDDNKNVWHLWDKIMKGVDVFKFSTDIGPKGIQNLLEYSKIDFNNIDYFAFHQANKQIVKSIAEYVGIPDSKYSTEAFSSFGNCGIASIVNDICLNLPKRKKDQVLLSSFGTGLSYAFGIFDLSNTFISDIVYIESKKDPNVRANKVNYWIDYFLGK